MGFTGHRYNNAGAPNLGLIYMNARYYVPYLNRFISADTIVPDPGRSIGYNRFAYVRQNPLAYTDPTGQYAICFQEGTQPGQDSSEPAKDSAIWQMCTALAEDDAFGPSGEFIVVTSNLEGATYALEWLARYAIHQFRDEKLSIVGFSYGGGAALEFAWLLNDHGGDTYKLWGGKQDIYAPDVEIVNLVMIDPVLQSRGLTRVSFYRVVNRSYQDGKILFSVPENVDSATLLYAPENQVAGLFPTDNAVREMHNALVVEMAETNHCTIAWTVCEPGGAFGPIEIPAQVPTTFPRKSEPYNRTTYNRVLEALR
jgi:RHS repeat-associated protein